MSETMLQHVLANPPECLSEVAGKPLHSHATKGAEVASFLLSSKTGEVSAQVHGYLSGRFNEAVKTHEFISPILVEWPATCQINVIFDSEKHGYHAALGLTSANLRGSGETNIWKCPKCSETRFEVTACFDYYGGASDLWEDEPELSIENYFNGIRIFAKCVGCLFESQVAGMDV